MNRWYEERDRMRAEVLSRDGEIEKVKIDHTRKEMELRSDMEAKYRSMIDGLKKERENLADTLNSDISDLKDEMNRSLKISREELSDKEKELAARLALVAERDNRIKELEKNIVAINADNRARLEKAEEEKNRLDVELRALRDSYTATARRSDDAARTADTRESVEIKRTVDEIAARYRILENDAAIKDAEIANLKKIISENVAARSEAGEGHVLAPRPEVVSADNPPAPAAADGKLSDRRDSGAIRSFWDNLNRPVIEIGKKSRRDQRAH